MLRRKKIKERRSSKPIQISNLCSELLKKHAKSPNQDLLSHIWENWDMVVGEELVLLAKPLGSKGNTLLIGADTPLDLQEVRMQYSEILERANEFLKAFNLENYFTKIEFTLMQGKHSLQEKAPPPKHFTNILPPKPKRYGEKIDFKGNKSLERCYEAFCKRLELEDKSR